MQATFFNVGLIGFSTPVVICDEEDDKLSYVDWTWAAVVESSLKRQICQIQENKH